MNGRGRLELRPRDYERREYLVTPSGEGFHRPREATTGTVTCPSLARLQRQEWQDWFSL